MISVRADLGGGPEHIFRLVKKLQNEIDYYIACPQEEPYWTRYCNLISVVNLISIPHRKFTLTYLWKLYCFCKLKKIEVIHSHGKGAGVYSRVLGILCRLPVIHTFHGIHIESYSPVAKKIYLYLENVLSYLTSKIICVSNSEYELAVELCISNDSKLIVINNGVEIQKNICLEAKRPYKIVSMSRFTYQKYSDLVINIWEEIVKRGYEKEVQFHFLGTGTDLNHIRKMVKGIGAEDNIVFHGPADNPLDYLKDCYCYLSTSRWEGMPLAVLEAMSVGLPIVASDVTGNCDVVIEGLNGYLYPLDRPDVAAEKIIQLITDPDRWMKLVLNSRRSIENDYSIELTAEKTSKLYYSTSRFV